MRENRTYGSEGGEGQTLPDPYRHRIAAWGGFEMFECCRVKPEGDEGRARYSGRIRVAAGRPASSSWTPAQRSSDIRRRVSLVALPVWGSAKTLSSSR